MWFFDHAILPGLLGIRRAVMQVTMDTGLNLLVLTASLLQEISEYSLREFNERSLVKKLGRPVDERDVTMLGRRSKQPTTTYMMIACSGHKGIVETMNSQRQTYKQR